MGTGGSILVMMSLLVIGWCVGVVSVNLRFIKSLTQSQKDLIKEALKKLDVIQEVLEKEAKSDSQIQVFKDRKHHKLGLSETLGKIATYRERIKSIRSHDDKFGLQDVDMINSGDFICKILEK